MVNRKTTTRASPGSWKPQPQRRRAAAPRQIRSALPPLLLFAAIALQAAWLSGGVDQWTSSGPGSQHIDRLVADPVWPGRLLAQGDYPTPLITQDGGITWAELGLRGSPWWGVTSVTSYGANQMLVEMGAYLGFMGDVPPWGGWWRTVDGGSSWSEASVGLYTPVAASLSTPGMIYGIDGGHFCTSTDGGISWQARAHLDHFGQMLVSPGEPETIWLVGTMISKSTDGGVSWRLAGAQPQLQQIHILVAAGPNSDVLMVGDETNFWRSTDGGASWALTGPTGVRRAVTDPANLSRLYCTDTTHLYCSTDTGSTWTTLLTLDPSDYIYDLSACRGLPPTLFLATRRGLMTSQDGGSNWQPTGVGVYSRTRALAVSPQGASPLHACVDDGFFTSNDNGEHWSRMGDSFSVGSLAVAPGPSGPLYVTQDQHQVLKSSDGGTSWEVVLDSQVKSLGELSVAASAPEVIYVDARAERGLYRSTNAGRDWAYLVRETPALSLSAGSPVVDPSDSRHLLAPTVSGLYRSVDGGASWTSVPGFGDASFDSVVFHPLRPGLAFALTASARLFRSDDGGANWAAVMDIGHRIGRIQCDPANDRILYGVYGAIHQLDTYGGYCTHAEFPQVSVSDFVVSAAPTTLHVATEWGVYSFTPVSEGRSDFQVTHAAPLETTPPSTPFSYDLLITNRGPVDYVGPVRVEDSMYNTSWVWFDSPGWKPLWTLWDRDPDRIVLIRDGTFRVDETIRVCIQREIWATAGPKLSEAWAAPLRPVDPFLLNNASDSTNVIEPPRRDRARSKSPPPRRRR